MDCSVGSKARSAARVEFPAEAASDNAPAVLMKSLRSMNSPFRLEFECRHNAPAIAGIARLPQKGAANPLSNGVRAHFGSNPGRRSRGGRTQRLFPLFFTFLADLPMIRARS